MGEVSLVVRWLRLHIPVQGVGVQFLVGELDPASPTAWPKGKNKGMGGSQVASLGVLTVASS